MAKILNTKEQVIDFQLTNYGKSKFFKGEFAPRFYSFFDDDIIYDLQWAGTTEHPNSASVRITTMPRTECQYQVSTVDNKFAILEQPQRERDYANALPLGNCNLNSDYLVSWDVKYHYGQLSGSSGMFTGTYNNIKIPQLYSDIVYNSQVKMLNDLPQSEQESVIKLTNNENAAEVYYGKTSVFSDGSYLELDDPEFLVEIKENNGVVSNDNFEIEVFLDDNGNLRPLTFADRNNVEGAVKYWLDIEVDDEISPDLMCPLDIQDPKESIYQDQIFDCPKTGSSKVQKNVNVYDTHSDDGELC